MKAHVLSSSRHLLLFGAVLGALLFAVAGCGGGGSSSDGGTTANAVDAGSGSSGEADAGKGESGTPDATDATGQVEAEWQRPVGKANVTGYELLKASETRSLAKSLATAFELPAALKIKGVNGFGGGPFYNP
jgi:hypothetical protein